MKLNSYRMHRPDLVVGYMKRQSKKDRAYPYVLGVTFFLLIVLCSIKAVM